MFTPNPGVERHVKKLGEWGEIEQWCIANCMEIKPRPKGVSRCLKRRRSVQVLKEDNTFSCDEYLASRSMEKLGSMKNPILRPPQLESGLPL